MRMRHEIRGLKGPEIQRATGQEVLQVKWPEQRGPERTEQMVPGQTETQTSDHRRRLQNPQGRICRLHHTIIRPN